MVSKPKNKEDDTEDSSSDEKVKPKIMIIFGQHARELISPEAGLNFLKALCGKENLGGMSDKERKLILNSIDLTIIPNANPAGRRFTEKGNFCHRMNMNNVDLNRNYPVGWRPVESYIRQKNSEDEEFQTVPGSKPFSEKESKVVSNVVDKINPHAFLDVHSGMQGLLLPYAYAKKSTGKFNNVMMRISEKIKKKDCKDCKFGNSVDVVGYESHGCALDYMFKEKGIPIVSAWEIYGDNDSKKANQIMENKFQQRFRKVTSAAKTEFLAKMNSELAIREDAHECFVYFNPEMKDDYEQTVKKWTNALVNFIVGVKSEKPDKLKKELMHMIANKLI